MLAPLSLAKMPTTPQASCSLSIVCSFIDHCPTCVGTQVDERQGGDPCRRSCPHHTGGRRKRPHPSSPQPPPLRILCRCYCHFPRYDNFNLPVRSATRA